MLLPRLPGTPAPGIIVSNWEEGRGIVGKHTRVAPLRVVVAGAESAVSPCGIFEAEVGGCQLRRGEEEECGDHFAGVWLGRDMWNGVWCSRNYTQGVATVDGFKSEWMSAGRDDSWVGAFVCGVDVLGAYLYLPIHHIHKNLELQLSLLALLSSNPGSLDPDSASVCRPCSQPRVAAWSVGR